MDFIVSASTDVGTEKDTNQDSYDLRVISTHNGSAVFAVLCDGMGGLSMGEVASSSLVMAFSEWSEARLTQLFEGSISELDIRDEWLALAGQYNEKIKIYGANRGVRLGTTLTAMLITEEKYCIINIGDTRAYEIFDGVEMLTHDHSLVARELALGQITEEQARKDPRRNILLQCVGASEQVYPDVFFGETKLNAVYMLCSDGFRHEISENEIYEFFNPDAMYDEESMKNNSDYLIELNKQRNERDNITVLTIRTF